jgi:ANTAR domain/GAF domain
MTPRTAAQALAAATSALTGDSDVTDILARLVRDTAEVLAAQAVGLLMIGQDGDLELLSASSHQAAELELFQIQHDDGPCVEVIRTGTAAAWPSAAEMLARWPATGQVIVGAGFQSAQAYPLRWHGAVIGAMNIFSGRPSSAGADADAGALGQAFADVAAVVIVQSAEVTADQITDRVRQALAARTVIEQAKGVLAYSRGLDMAAAYDLLRELAAASGRKLTAAAADVIAQAQRQNGN